MKGCPHLWLPHHGRLFRSVICGRCFERRRVKWAPGDDYQTITDALGEAIDRGIIPAHEVLWRGQRLR